MRKLAKTPSAERRAMERAAMLLLVDELKEATRWKSPEEQSDSTRHTNLAKAQVLGKLMSRVMNRELDWLS